LDQRELVAAEAGDGVGVADACLEAPGAQLDQPVAGRVPERVVDALEAPSAPPPAEVLRVLRDLQARIRRARGEAA
jgi:hypothetical protein